jgi:tetratricopeptide (TPR) repeat protein
MTRRLLTAILPIFCAAFILLARVEVSPAQQQPRQATSQEESFMMGMIVGAIQDAHGGYLGEARGRFRKIMSELEKRTYSPRLRWQAQNEYGRFLLMAGDEKGAVKALAQSKEEAKALTGKEQFKSTFDLASAYSQAGELDMAIKEYRAALALDPASHNAMLELGSAYRRAKLFPEARELYQKIIAENPKYAAAYSNLGNVHLEQGELEAAVAAYEKFAAYSDDKAVIAQNFLNAGFRHGAAGNHEKALALYRRALEVTPDNPLAYTDIGWSLLKMGKKEEAIEAFEKALKLKPKGEVKEYARQGLAEARGKQ